MFYFKNIVFHTIFAFILFFKLNAQKSNSDKINSVRDHVIRHYGSDIADDVASVRSANWYFERYLSEYNYKEKEAERAAVESFDYFHREKFNELNDTYFPSEAYALGGIYRFGLSKFGQPLIGAVMSHVKPLGLRLSKEPIIKLTQKFSLYQIYRTLFEAKENNFIIYVVFTNTTLENTDFGLFRTTILTLNKYFASVPLKLYVIGMNKRLEVPIKLMANLLKPSLKKRIQYVPKIENIEELVSLDDVPVHAGGRNTFFSRIPANVKSGKCLTHLRSISDKEWDIYTDINILAIQEGMREANVTSIDNYLRSC